MNLPEILPGSRGRDLLGEGPLWDGSTSRLYTIDVLAKQIRCSDLDGQNAISIPTPTEPGFIARAARGNLIVGLRDGLHVLDELSLGFGRLTYPDFDTTCHRINDGKVDRAQRLWYGTMELTERTPTGHLYTYDGIERRVRGGVTVSNGLGWSPDGSHMYYADSGAGTITAFDIDSDGMPHAPRVIVRDADCFSDGLTVDAEGCIWSAKWEGGRVVRYSPDGRALQTITLPVSRVTSCAFVGKKLDILAVTTAKPDAARVEPLAGSVFLINAGVVGLPEPRYAGPLVPL